MTYNPYTRKILTDVDDRLRKKSLPVTKADRHDIMFDHALRDMARTLFVSGGVGLSAVQIGMRKRACVLVRDEQKQSAIALINPKIVKFEGERQWLEEGCLSKPGYRCDMHRYTSLTVRAEDINGSKTTFRLTGLLAQCVQHELDHMDGNPIWGLARTDRRAPSIVSGDKRIFLPV